MNRAGAEHREPPPLLARSGDERARDAAAYSFAAGAGPLPPEVLARLHRELEPARGCGNSLLELPFTSGVFRAHAARLAENLTELLAIPEGYEVLFVYGGATAQFAAVPLNLLGRTGQADYVDTGYWSRKAAAEAARFGRVRTIAHPEAAGPARIPPAEAWRPDAGAAYCHIVTNETAEGVQYHGMPDTGGVPLVADMSSDFLTRPLDVARWGLVYASAQKNLGIPGFAVVIVRRALLLGPLRGTPAVLDYRLLAEQRSLLNTPATFSILVAGWVTDWMRAQGGLAALEQASLRKSALVYAVLDGSDFFRCSVAREERSRVNICFALPSPALEEGFLRAAEAAGMTNLKGHPAVGGIRVSLYNGMPESGAAALADFMAGFARRHG